MSTVKPPASKPITPNTKVGDVLKEHPELLDVLLAQSPHFSRLKNPILRKIHGQLVTVGQAAAIAGLDPATLVRTLNSAIGHADATEVSFSLTSMAGVPEPPWLKSAPVAVDLDVREDQRRHADPFQRIMEAVTQVQDGQVLHLKNTFEPLPLYDVLGKRGFVAWARHSGSEEWDIYFLKVRKEQPQKEFHTGEPDGRADVAGSAAIDIDGPSATVTIDVSELTPPQPMIKILDALAKLGPGETLLVHHQRRPAYLYPKLAELGYQNKTIEKGPNQVEIYIRKS